MHIRRRGTGVRIVRDVHGHRVVHRVPVRAVEIDVIARGGFGVFFLFLLALVALADADVLEIELF